MMDVVLVFYFTLFFTFIILVCLHYVFQKPESRKMVSDWPKVSILVAARNEDKNIIACLTALSRIDYPSDRWEVLIGNDQSTDLTKVLVLDFIKSKSNFRLIDIVEQIGTAKGKANVLAHLAKEASGDFYFITDADIEVPVSWCKSLLSHWNEKVATVSGVTVIGGSSFFERMQCMEWVYAFGMVQCVSERGIPVSAVGNNMMISREAYEATGGYENIPFSVTEDFELFRQTLKRGYGYKNIMEPEVVAISKAIPNLNGLLKQRKRWMSGAFHLPFILVICLFLQAIFFPMIILSIIFVPAWGILLWLFKMVVQQVIISLVMKRMNVKDTLIRYFILFEIYSGILSFLFLLNYILPGGIEWKGRKY